MLEANSRSSSSSCVLVNAVRILLLLGSWLELLSGGGRGVQRGKRSDSRAVGRILWYKTSRIPGLWSFIHLFAPNETHSSVNAGASVLSLGTQILGVTQSWHCFTERPEPQPSLALARLLQNLDLLPSPSLLGSVPALPRHPPPLPLSGSQHHFHHLQNAQGPSPPIPGSPTLIRSPVLAPLRSGFGLPTEMQWNCLGSGSGYEVW